MEVWEVSFQIYSFIKAETKKEAIDMFIKDNNLDESLEIYCSADEVEEDKEAT